MMLTDNKVNVVGVKFLKTSFKEETKGNYYLYPQSKNYYFKINPNLSRDLQLNQVVFVKDIRGKEVFVIIQELLSLPLKKVRSHAPVLKTTNLIFDGKKLQRINNKGGIKHVK